MAITIEIVRGRHVTYTTCDACGLPILGAVEVHHPYDVYIYENCRHTHAGRCPEPDGVAGGDGTCPGDAGGCHGDCLVCRTWNSRVPS